MKTIIMLILLNVEKDLHVEIVYSNLGSKAHSIQISESSEYSIKDLRTRNDNADIFCTKLKQDNFVHGTSGLGFMNSNF